MSEEEKKAYNYLKNSTDGFLNSWNVAIKSDNFKKYDYMQLRILLNLIDNQQKEIEDFENIKNEHRIMKRIIQENGLWETLLNDNEFLKHLNEEN